VRDAVLHRTNLQGAKLDKADLTDATHDQRKWFGVGVNMPGEKPFGSLKAKNCRRVDLCTKTQDFASGNAPVSGYSRPAALKSCAMARDPVRLVAVIQAVSLLPAPFAAGLKS
jgi:hypothetical protein